MKLFLQVGLTRWQKDGAGNQYLNYAASLASDMLGTDLDSQADPMIANMVLRLVDQSRNIFLFVIANDPNLTLGAANRVFTDLLKTSEKVTRVVVCGDHRTAESMLSGFHDRLVKETDPEKIKKMILEFSTSG